MPTTANEVQSPPATRSTLAIIGGSGLYCLQADAAATTHEVSTPFAAAPVRLSLEHSTAGAVWFLPRHGREHNIAPHEINYRANLWALRQVGVRRIVAVNAVGGISDDMLPGTFVLPDQIIDYSWGREHTFCTGDHAFDKHIDFTWPYSRRLGAVLQSAARECQLALRQGGVYACTQGPRLETAAEVRRLARDGCDIVGMTGMPEAALARELGLDYACLALVVNRAAGLGSEVISPADMREVMEAGIEEVRRLLQAALPALLQAD